MGLFTKDKKLEFEKIPSAPEQDQARNYLQGLYTNNLNYPEMGVAELSDSERSVQDQIKQYLTGSQGDYALSRQYFTDVLNDNYDPATSQYYAGVRGQLDTQKAEAQAGVRRTAQKAGSSRSTPFLGIEAKTGQAYDYEKDRVLGAMTQAERDRKAGAATSLASLRGQEINQLGTADQIASKEREIQQMKLQAAYNKVIQDMLAPYLYNANIASAILNEVRYAGVQTGGGLTDLGFGAAVAGSVVSGMATGGTGFFA